MEREILLVDDRDVLLELGKASLEYMLDDTTVETCDSGDRAVERIEDEEYDYVITDYRMPGSISGSELIEETRNDTDARMIMYSASEEARAEANELSVAFYQKNGENELYRSLADEVELDENSVEEAIDWFLS